MNTPYGFTSQTRVFAFLSALFLSFISLAPTAMAREGTPGTHIATQAIGDNSEPGCD